ncbi:MAG: hypothetical protein P9L99_06355 [Candidatus Lernaella stagnicola]|nr:hypothetical protein [Candidatus Lernaella stagnicola]
MRKILDEMHNFLVSGFSGDLGTVLGQVFFVVIGVLLFFALYTIVRFFTDPITLKVLRVRDRSPLPNLVALFVSAILFVYMLIGAYRHIPATRQTVLGQAGQWLDRFL